MKLMFLLIFMSGSIISQAQNLNSNDTLNQLVLRHKVTGAKFYMKEGVDVIVKYTFQNRTQYSVGTLKVVNDTTIRIDSLNIHTSSIRTIMLTNDSLQKTSHSLTVFGTVLASVGVAHFIGSAFINKNDLNRLSLILAGSGFLTISTIPYGIGYRVKKGKKFKKSKWDY